jgi:7-cyano-7-deazaguanine synthase
MTSPVIETLLPKTTTTSVVLLSGGLDSAVALTVARQQGSVKLALTVNYGQRAFANELTAAKGLAAWANVPHQVIDLPWLANLLPTGMQAAGASHHDLPTTGADGLSAVWVPNRNGVLLNIAAAFAEQLGANTVVFGANADEGQAFADNTPAYRQACTAALAYSTQNHVQVWAPLEQMSKRDIWVKGQALNVPLHTTWSCYEAAPTPCGVCMSCQHRATTVSHNV